MAAYGSDGFLDSRVQHSEEDLWDALSDDWGTHWGSASAAEAASEGPEYDRFLQQRLPRYQGRTTHQAAGNVGQRPTYTSTQKALTDQFNYGGWDSPHMLEGSMADQSHRNLIAGRGAGDNKYQGGSSLDPNRWRYGAGEEDVHVFPSGVRSVKWIRPQSTQIGQGDFFNMQDIYAADEKLAREQHRHGMQGMLKTKFPNTDAISYGRPTGRHDYEKSKAQWAHDVKNRAAAMSGGETTAWDPSNYRSANEGATVPPVPVPPASGGGGGSQFDWMNKAFARTRADMSRQQMTPGYYNQFNIPKSEPKKNAKISKIHQELARFAHMQGRPDLAAKFGNWKTGYG